MVGNKELTNYIRSIQKNMNCSSENKKRFLEELESDIREDIQKNPDMSYKDIIGKYGSPENIAYTYNSLLEPDQYWNKIQKKRRLKKYAVAAVILIVCFTIGYILFFQKTMQEMPIVKNGPTEVIVR